MKKISLILVIVMLFSFCYAEKKHSVGLSFISSLVLPGAGDYYAGRAGRGSIALVTEIALITSYFHFSNEEDNYEQSYKLFTKRIMNIPTDRPDSFYEQISKFETSDTYNENVRLNAQNYYGYGTEEYYAFVERNTLNEDEEWDWNNNTNYRKYREIRQNKQKSRQNVQLVAGIIVVNHLYSAISSALNTSRDNKKFMSKHTVFIQPDVENHGAMINYEFNF